MCGPGWLHKEVKSGAKSNALKLKKRWFILTNNSLDYYKSAERSTSKMGTLVLNSLCSVVQPDEKVHKETGELQYMTQVEFRMCCYYEMFFFWCLMLMWLRCRILEHCGPWEETLLPALHQAAKRGNEVGFGNSGGH